MTPAECIDETRGILDDYSSLVTGDPDRLWSDERILRRLNEAQIKLARRAWVITDDTTTSTCVITLIENQPDYTYHKSVLRVLSAKLSDSDYPLIRRNWEQIYGPVSQDLDFFDTNFSNVFDPGRPQIFATDTATRKITVWRKPNADAALLTLKLRVARMPINLIVKAPSGGVGAIEVPEEYHINLCDYAAGKLLVATVNNEVRGAGSAITAGRELIADFNNLIREAERDLRRQMLAAPRFAFSGWAARG